MPQIFFCQRPALCIHRKQSHSLQQGMEHPMQCTQFPSYCRAPYHHPLPLQENTPVCRLYDNNCSLILPSKLLPESNPGTFPAIVGGLIFSFFEFEFLFSYLSPDFHFPFVNNLTIVYENLMNLSLKKKKKWS